MTAAASSSTAPAPALANADPALFKDVHFFISDTLEPSVRAAIADLLVDSGATPCRSDHPASSSSSSRLPRFDLSSVTHFITDTLDFPERKLVEELNAQEGGKTNVGLGIELDGGKGKGKDADSVHGQKIEIVTPAWVTRSYDLQILQSPRFYSADKALYFSGTVICTSELPQADMLSIHAGVLSLGGQVRRELTREVTHLICPAEHGAKYEMAIKFGTELGIVVVLPHWFTESLRLARLVPVDIYRFPSPPFTTSLRDPSISSKPFADRLFDYWKTRLEPSSSSASKPPSPSPNTATHVILGTNRANQVCAGAARDEESYVRTMAAMEVAGREGQPIAGVPPAHVHDSTMRPFTGMRFYLASDLGLSVGLERALRARIAEGGGSCWSFAFDVEVSLDMPGAGEGGERSRRATTEGIDAWEKRRRAEKRLKKSDIVITRTREGWEYWTAYDLGLSIANLNYLYHCISTSTLPSPLSRLLHYPLPSLSGIPEWSKSSDDHQSAGKTKEIIVTVSNYSGPARDYVRALIDCTGAKFEGSMTKSTDYVITPSEYGSKVQHARTWGLPLVTHLWLEALILEWRFIPPSTHSSYLLPLASSFGASSTYFAAILGDTAYTREGIAKWAERDEVQQMRKEALRPVEELERLEKEEQQRRRAKLAKEAEAATHDEENIAEKGEGSEAEADGAEDGAATAVEIENAARNLPTPPEQPRKPPIAVPAPPKPPRQLSTLVVDTLDRHTGPVAGPSKSRSKTPHESHPVSAKVSPTAKQGLMDVDDDVDGLVTPARPLEPAKKKVAKGSTPNAKPVNGTNSKKRQRSSSLSSATSSSSDEDELPQSAKAMRKTFAQISDENLVVIGTKRGAAAKARQALAVVMEDRNAFEKELKSSGRKKKYGDALGPSRKRSRSPTKRATQDGDGSGEEDEDEPESSALRAKAKAKRPPKEENEEDDRPKKKPKPAAAVVKSGAKSAFKAFQASGGASNTQDGVVSSFDRPPHGKPPQPVSKTQKIKIISTGLGLDKSSDEIKALKSFGAAWTDQPKDATHLVVKSISRTEKFLCCLPFAPKIVTIKWIEACLAAGKLIDEQPYLLRDTKKEKEIGDSLEAILGRARKGKLFAGKTVYISRSTSPDATTMQKIIEASGGIVHVKDLSKFVKKIVDDPDALVISCPNDRREWEKLAAAPNKKKIYSVEAALTAVLHQNFSRGFNDANRCDFQLEK
ncbi:BRCT domain protein Brc1 [Rhodotorula toruloides]|uniref:BRCT domain protein Brc1 n=1 Tax=Rhodotorula toruloides TaxID=5286 RepID=A0A511KBW9_RHOTO|nr:BRCT domain protein Brc1 [Rhodotorula toruloides]